MIREALDRDIPEILPMLHRFHGAAGMAGYAAIDQATLAAAVQSYICADEAQVLVSGPVGAITGTSCALTVPAWFNAGVLEASDIWLWVEPEARGTAAGFHLLKAMEAWAQDKGAALMFLATIDALYPQGRERTYRRLNYEPHGQIYIKRL